MPERISINISFVHSAMLQNSENSEPTNWRPSSCSNQNSIIHTATPFSRNFVSMCNNTLYLPLHLDCLATPPFRNTITPPFPTTSATSPSYTPDQRTSTTYSTNFAATQRPNMMWHGCLDPTRHPWRSCTFSSGIVDNWMNLTEHKPPHWLPKPYNSKEDIRHQPTYQSNSIPYV